MMSNRGWMLWSVLLLVGVSRVVGQDSCPAMVAAALTAVEQSCSEIGRNQACFGHAPLDAEFKQESASFAASGDVVNTADLQSLTSGQMDENGDWGVALLSLQATISDAESDQNVTMLLFGQASIADAPSEVAAAPIAEPSPVSLQATAPSNVNIRGGASTNDAVIGSLSAGNSLTTVGRNDDGSWLRVALPDGNNGWVAAQVVSLDGDVNLLPVVSGDAAPPPQSNPAPIVASPLQSFYFSTGVDDSPCNEAPDSGILIQLPEYRGTEYRLGYVTLMANGVEIQVRGFGATIYMQAQPGGDMIVSAVAANATVSAGGTSVYMPSGTRVRIPLDAAGAAAGTPVGPEPYDMSRLGALPLRLLPEEEVELAPALSEEAIRLQSMLPPGGIYALQGNTDQYCPDFDDPYLVQPTDLGPSDFDGPFSYSADSLDEFSQTRATVDRLRNSALIRWHDTKSGTQFWFNLYADPDELQEAIDSQEDKCSFCALVNAEGVYSIDGRVRALDEETKGELRVSSNRIEGDFIVDYSVSQGGDSGSREFACTNTVTFAMDWGMPFPDGP